jgi:DNA-binding CsgD family transcriptional regulator
MATFSNQYRTIDPLNQITSGATCLEPFADTIRQQPQPAMPDAERPDRQPDRLKSLMVGLSTRQQEVLQLLADGQSTRDIAISLGITQGTLRKHLAKIYRILKVKNRTEAVATIAPSTAPRSRIINILSVREQEVLKLLSDHRSAKAMALNLGIAVSTVRNHLINIYHKLKVRNRREAVALFRSKASLPDGISHSDALLPPIPARLSPREQEALTLLATDRSREDIALDLGITEGTLRGLVSGIYRKLGVKNQQGAIATTRPSSAQLSILTHLSLREQEVLRLLAEEQSTKEIARNLNVSVGTVFVYPSNICRIIGVKSRAEAVSQFRSASIACRP